MRICVGVSVTRRPGRSRRKRIRGAGSVDRKTPLMWVLPSADGSITSLRLLYRLNSSATSLRDAASKTSWCCVQAVAPATLGCGFFRAVCDVTVICSPAARRMLPANVVGPPAETAGSGVVSDVSGPEPPSRLLAARFPPSSRIATRPSTHVLYRAAAAAVVDGCHARFAKPQDQTWTDRAPPLPTPAPGRQGPFDSPQVSTRVRIPFIPPRNE